MARSPRDSGVEASFLRSILEAPEDDAPRLIYADWLDDHDQPERAELIRLQCERASREGEAGALRREIEHLRRDRGEGGFRENGRFLQRVHAALEPERPARGHESRQQREDGLLKAHRAVWLEGLPVNVEFRRGFPEIIETTAHEYLRHATALERLAPAQAVRLKGFAPKDPEELERLGLGDEWEAGREMVRRLAECPQLEHWTELDFLTCPGLENYETLLVSPHLTRLRRLSAPHNEIGPGVAYVADPQFSDLRWLDLYNSNSAGGRPGDDDFIRIVTSPDLANLEYLNYGSNRASDEGLAALAISPTAGRLRTLGLCSNDISNDGLDCLADSRHLPSLQHLDVSASMSDPGIDDEGLRTLVESPLFAQLRFLDVSYNKITDAGIHRLAASPSAAGLRSVVLGGTAIDWRRGDYPGRLCLSEASLRYLAESPHLPGLRRLELLEMPINDDTAHLLATSRGLEGLRELVIEASPGLTRQGREALEARFGKDVTIEEPRNPPSIGRSEG